ncbi:MAG: DUF2480 family protein [Balneolaceae bacterium]
MSEIINKVKQSKLETIDLEAFAAKLSIRELDLEPFLFQGLILKEKEYREALDAHNWEQYGGQILAVHCSTDAIIPKWAYMLVQRYAAAHAAQVYYGLPEEARRKAMLTLLDEHDWEQYSDKFILLKGCSKVDVHPEVYMAATEKLLPRVRKLMYGEACSNVPVYNKPRS